MPSHEQKTLAVIGAGPKGLAVAVKAKVLEEFGLPADRVILIEKNGVAANWSGDHGFTNGEMKLGTSPEKDVVFPLETDVGDEELNKRIRRRLMDFTWITFMIQTGQHSDWVDRGRPAPCHLLWATYLRWVAAQLGPQTKILAAEVTRVDLTENGDRWKLRMRSSDDGTFMSLEADRLMLTGPGKTRVDFTNQQGSLPDGVYDLESFWSQLKSDSFPAQGRLALVGAGENAASVLLALARHAPHLRVDVISPKGFVSTRAENYYENRFYSQPVKSGWTDLSVEDRIDFISRTDLGVFSVHAMRVLNEEVRHRIVAGRLIGLESAEGGLSAHLSYGPQLKTQVYDRVILATGFDQATALLSLFSARAVEAIERALGSPLRSETLARAIRVDLSVEGLFPSLHLPMFAGVMQGPGFANLSCLGLLSDRVIIHERISSVRNSLRLELAEVAP